MPIPTERPMRIAILGAGAVTRELYLPALRLVREIELAAIVDPSLAGSDTEFIGGAAARVSLPFHTFFEDARLLKALRLDAVVVALPNSLHEAAVVRSLENGLHVLCEKPLSLSEASCLKIAHKAEEHGRVVAVGMPWRFFGGVGALRWALKEQLVGQSMLVEATDGGPFCWSSTSGSFFQASNGGVLADIGVHYLDLLSFVFGDLEPVDYSDDWAGGCEANANFTLRTRDGVPVRLGLSRDRKLKDSIVVYGEKGILELHKDDRAACQWRPAHAPSLSARLLHQADPTERNCPDGSVSCFAEQLRQYVEAVRGIRPVHVTPFRAAETTRLIEWAYRRRNTSGNRIQQNRPRSTDSPSVCVTGGTGFIGGRLIERLASGSDWGRIIVPVRNYLTCANAARFGAELPQVNLLDFGDVRRALQGARQVFHLAYGSSGRNASRITIEGTRNVVEAAIAEGVESVVVLSTINVYGYPDTDVLVDESFPYRPSGGEYGRSKAKMERWCLQRSASSTKTRIVVLNPGCVYGPGGGTFTSLPAELARKGAFCLVQEGCGIANYVFVDNLCDAMLLAADCEEAHGRRFLIVDGWCAWATYFERLLGNALGVLPSYAAADLLRLERATRRNANLLDVLRAAARSAEVMETASRVPLLGSLKKWGTSRFPELRQRLRAPGNDAVIEDPRTAGVPPSWLAELFGPTCTKFSSALAHQVLHWRPAIDLHEGLLRATRWLSDVGLIDGGMNGGATAVPNGSANHSHMENSMRNWEVQHCEAPRHTQRPKMGPIGINGL